MPSNPLEYRGPDGEYHPYIDNLANDAVGGLSVGSGTGYADIEFLLGELESLGNGFRELYDLCVSKMTDYTLFIDTSNETLVNSHKMSYPDDDTPDSISFEEYIYNFSTSPTSSSLYVNRYYENKVRGIYGTNALDIAHVSRISYSEIKRIESFLEKYTGDIDDPSEFRTIEIFQDWAQNAKNILAGFRSAFTTERVVQIPNEEMVELTEARAKEFQGLFQSKLNVINAALSDLLSQLYKDWDLVSDIFYNKILGPSLSFSLNVTRDIVNGIDQNKAPILYREAQMSKAAFGSQFQTALADQIKRNQLYYDYLQRIAANMLQRDSYVNYLSQLSNKGTLIPNPFITKLEEETETVKNTINLLGDVDVLTYDANVSSDHNFLTDREDPTNHPHYVLKTGDNITGILDIDGRLIINDIDITDFLSDDNYGNTKFKANYVDWVGAKGSQTSKAKNDIVPSDLSVLSQSYSFNKKIEYILDFSISDSNVNGYEFEIIELENVFSSLEPLPNFVFNPIVLYDTRLHDPTDFTTLPNLGTGGAVFDLDIVDQGNGYYWAIKRKDWYTQGTTSGVTFPTGWDDFGGDFCDGGGMTFVFALPDTIHSPDSGTEIEWYINAYDDNGIALGMGGHADYLDGSNFPDGFVEIYGRISVDDNTNDSGSYVVWYSNEEVPRQQVSHKLIVVHIDPTNKTSDMWIVNNNSDYNIVHDPEENSYYEDFAQDDQCTYDSRGTTIDRMFWSLGYHSPIANPCRELGDPWSHVVGAAMFRGDAPDRLTRRNIYKYFFDTVSCGPPEPVFNVVGGYSHEAFALGNFLLVQRWFSPDYGFVVVDITDPTNPVIRGELTASGAPVPYHKYTHVSSATTDGTYLIVAGYVDAGSPTYIITSYLSIIDITSDPDNPSVVGEYTSASTLESTYAAEMVSPTIVAMAFHHLNQVRLIDISTPGTPVSVGSVTDSVNLNLVERMTYLGNGLLATAGRHDFGAGAIAVFSIVDCSIPATPSVVGSVQVVDIPTVFDIADLGGGYVLLTTFVNDSIILVNVSNPAIPFIVHTLTSTYLDNAYNLFVDGTYVYATSNAGGYVLKLDYTNPLVPTLVGVSGDAGCADWVLDPGNLTKNGKYFYLPAGDALGVYIIHEDEFASNTPTCGGVTVTPWVP